MPADGKPWAAIKDGMSVGTASTRKAAMNLLDRSRCSPDRHGFAIVVRAGTGEMWQRRGGSWFKTREGKR